MPIKLVKVSTYQFPFNKEQLAALTEEWYQNLRTPVVELVKAAIPDYITVRKFGDALWLEIPVEQDTPENIAKVEAAMEKWFAERAV